MPISRLKPFNITLLHPAGFIHALALKEAGVAAAIEQFLRRSQR
jgi:hypothetical protein